MRERPTRAQCEQAIAEGRVHGETGAGEYDPYAGSAVALLSRLWWKSYQEAAQARRAASGRPTRTYAESVAAIRAAGGGVDGDLEPDDDDAEP